MKLDKDSELKMNREMIKILMRSAEFVATPNNIANVVNMLTKEIDDEDVSHATVLVFVTEIVGETFKEAATHLNIEVEEISSSSMVSNQAANDDGGSDFGFVDHAANASKKGEEKNKDIPQ